MNKRIKKYNLFKTLADMIADSCYKKTPRAENRKIYYLQNVQGVCEFRSGDVAIGKKLWSVGFECIINFYAILGLFHVEIATVVEQYQHFL